MMDVPRDDTMEELGEELSHMDGIDAETGGVLPGAGSGADANEKASFWKLLILAAVFVAGVSVYIFRVDITDFVRASSFEASEEIRHSIYGVEFTVRGERVFNASKPRLMDAEEFNEVCPRKEVSANVLGCYTDGIIHVFDVRNEELAGMNTVTLVHEFWHAVYKRLSENEREKIREQVSLVYDELGDDKLRERLGYYERNMPEEVYGELHSIFATEFWDLPDELERHYARFIRNRGMIVELFDRYNERFVSLSERAQELVTQLNELADEINEESAEYEDNLLELNDLIEDFNRRASGGYFVSEAQFYAERAVLVSEQERLQSMRAELERMTAVFDDMRVELDEISLHIELLNNSIDSEFSPIPEL